MTQIGVTLHTFRDIPWELPVILHRVAEYGYDGVEFADRVHRADIQDVKTALDRTGLESIAAHVDLPHLESEWEALLERYATVDCDTLVIPHLPAEHFVSLDRIDELATQLNTLADRLDDHGFRLAIHTSRTMHRQVTDRYGLGWVSQKESIPVSGWIHFTRGMDQVLPVTWRGNSGFQRLVTETDPAKVTFEIDTQHAVSTGRDPHDLFELVSNRLFAIHLSDAVRHRRIPPTYQSASLGEGIVDIKRDIEGGFTHGADWLIGEVDHPLDPQESLSSIMTTIQTNYSTG